MSDDELAFAPALELARLVKAREVSPVELVDLYLQRIDKLNPALGAFITVAADQAQARAKEAEARVGDDDLSPFHGIPISIKDLSETAGIRTTHGCAAWVDRVPSYDDVHVERIKRAGFIVLGKTVVPELGPVNISEPPGYPPGRNPWDTERSCGGSSGGAAAAVAAGLCPVSQGSDGGGSIRIPASWCGVFGLKPARGRVTYAPRMMEFFSVLGPISRSVADAAALLDVMAGPATGDFFWAPPPRRPFVEEVSEPVRPLRVAMSTDAGEGIAVADANSRAVSEAAELLASLGHHVEAAAPPVVGPELLSALQVLFCASYAGRDETELPPLETLTPWGRMMVEMGRAITAGQYVQAQRAVQIACRRTVAFFDDVDVLVTPTVAAPPPRVGQYKDIDMSRVADLFALTPFTGLWNTTGQPAVSIPWALDEAGLPVGVQVVGRPHDEATLLALSGQIEAARPWRDWRPTVS